MELSQEERERRRQVALDLHQRTREDGTRVFGGPQPGSGRPRLKTATETVAEKVAEKGQVIFDALMDGLAKDKPQYVRNDSARTLLTIEQKHLENVREEERELEAMRRDELLDEVTELLVGLDRAGRLSLPVIEGRALALPAGDDGDNGSQGSDTGTEAAAA